MSETTVMQDLEAAIMNRLSPFLKVNDGPLIKIHSYNFDSPEEFEELIRTYKDATPCGFLSAPSWVHSKARPRGRVKRLDATFSFMFAAVLAGVRPDVERQTFIDQSVSLINELLPDHIFDPALVTITEGHQFFAIEAENGVIKKTPRHVAVGTSFTIRIIGPPVEVSS